jgi:hypothetical protein
VAIIDGLNLELWEWGKHMKKVASIIFGGLLRDESDCNFSVGQVSVEYTQQNISQAEMCIQAITIKTTRCKFVENCQ